MMSVLKEIKVTSKKVYLEFNDSKIKILPETYSRLNLKTNEDYDISYILNENKIDEVYNDSVKKLSTKIKSEHEFINDLDSKHVIDYDSILIVVDKLKENDYLNDKKFSSLYIKELNKEYYGKYFIINELRKKGIGNNIIATLEFPYDLELKKAKTYFKLISNKYASNNYAKQKRKIYDELLKHGFDADIIREMISKIPLIKEKEKEKLRRDLEKIKHKLNLNGVLTEANKGKIISELIKIGYSYSDIVINLREEEE